MKVLITGVAGFIGSNLGLYLLNNNIKVTGIDNLSDYYSIEIKEKNIKNFTDSGGVFHKLDLLNQDLFSINNDFDFIVHLAAQPGISENITYDTYENNNVKATFNILEFAKTNCKLELFIFGSTSSVYGKIATSTEDSYPLPASYYGLTKLAAEQLVMMYGREFNMPVTSLRLYSVYGERERPDKLFPKLFESFFRNETISIFKSSFNHYRSFTYVDDIIYAIELAMANKKKCYGEIFNVGNENSVSVKESLSIFNSVVGKNIEVKILPDRQGDQLSTKANIYKIKKVLGFCNKFSFEEGLKKTFEWYKKERSC